MSAPDMDMPTTMNGSMDNMDMDMMKMYFHIGREPYILIKEWVVSSDGAMFGWCVFFFVLAILYELLKYFRQMHSTRAMLRVTVSEENGIVSSSSATQDTNIESIDKFERPLHSRERSGQPVGIKMLSIAHFIQTALHMIQMFVSYILMLAFMLFNVWICLSIILGSGVGYFLIGSRKAATYSAIDDDHCH